MAERVGEFGFEGTNKFTPGGCGCRGRPRATDENDPGGQGVGAGNGETGFDDGGEELVPPSFLDCLKA